MSQEESKITTNTTKEVEDNSKDEKGLFKKGHKKMGGKKKGKKNQKTIKKEIVENEFKNRILGQIQDLLTAQLNIAKGTSYLYKIVTHKGPKGGEGRKEHILVTDPYEIKDFLDELEGESEVNPNTDNDDYYYISTKQPENKALDSLINRVFGKPKESLDLTTGGEKIYNWGNYGKDNNIQPKAVDPATPRTGEKVEGSGSAQESGKDNGNS